MTTMMKERATELMLRLCYNCDDVHKCDTEEKCLECFAEQHLLDEPEDEMRELFRLYAY